MVHQLLINSNHYYAKQNIEGSYQVTTLVATRTDIKLQPIYMKDKVASKSMEIYQCHMWLHSYSTTAEVNTMQVLLNFQLDAF